VTLFGSQGERLFGFLDHLAHFADAFGALGLTALRGENVFRALGPCLDGKVDVAGADAVTVTNVQGGLLLFAAENDSL